MKRTKKWTGYIVAVVLGALFFGGSLGVIPQAYADVNLLGPACSTQSGNGSQNSAACNANTTTNPISGPNSALYKASKIIALVSGIAAVIIIIVAGIIYITSQGDPGKTNSARNTIIYASVGLFVIVIAQSIVILIVRKL